jgi:hypothetical protein
MTCGAPVSGKVPDFGLIWDTCKVRLRTLSVAFGLEREADLFP